MHGASIVNEFTEIDPSSTVAREGQEKAERESIYTSAERIQHHALRAYWSSKIVQYVIEEKRS
jgi:hypothetical protein